MRTIHHLVILLALTARSATAVAFKFNVRISTKDRLTALSHTPEGVGFFGREKVCEACAPVVRVLRLGNQSNVHVSRGRVLWPGHPMLIIAWEGFSLPKFAQAGTSGLRFWGWAWAREDIRHFNHTQTIQVGCTHEQASVKSSISWYFP
ncbi:hypothetical protein V8E53_013014 [Lactarius tabidus]